MSLARPHRPAAASYDRKLAFHGCWRPPQSFGPRRSEKTDIFLNKQLESDAGFNYKRNIKVHSESITNASNQV